MAHSLKEVKGELAALKDRIQARYTELHLEEVESELTDLRQKMEDPRLFADDSKVNQVRDLQTRISFLDKKISAWKALTAEMADALEYAEIAEMENAENLTGEIEKRLNAARVEFDKLDLESLLNGPDDMNNAFVNIHPGAGGTESQDWADMLLRAYTRYAEKQGFEVEMVDYQEGEEAGIKNATLYIRGPNAFGYLKAENGIHRLVRISPFDSNKRRHTSFAAVHVSPEISDEVEVEVLEKDLRVDVYRALSLCYITLGRREEAEIRKRSRLLEKHGLGVALERGQRDREPVLVLRQLLTPGLTLFRQLFERRHEGGQKLEDNRRGNVGVHPHGEDREVTQCAAREQVQEPEKLAVGEHVAQLGQIHARHRNMRGEAVDDEDEQGEQELPAQIR